MKNLQIRELPDSIYNQLREIAKRENRSLAQQAIVTIKNGLNIPINSVKRRIDLLSKLDSFEVKKCPKIDQVRLIRKDRER